NEGASRGLTKRFTDAVSKLNLPTGDRQWLRIKEDSRANAFPPEFNMVGGLLRWIGQGDEGSRIYFTRSSLVARVAACLKAAGYMIGNIHAWNGVGDSPRPSHSRS